MRNLIQFQEFGVLKAYFYVVIRVWFVRMFLTQKQINLFITAIMQMIQRVSVITIYSQFMKTGREYFGLEQEVLKPEVGQKKED